MHDAAASSESVQVGGGETVGWGNQSPSRHGLFLFPNPIRVSRQFQLAQTFHSFAFVKISPRPNEFPGVCERYFLLLFLKVSLRCLPSSQSKQAEEDPVQFMLKKLAYSVQ